MVMVRALLMSPRVLVPPVTPMVRAPQVSNIWGSASSAVLMVRVLQALLPLTVLMMLMVGGGVGAGSGCRSARGRSLACCGRCWPACLLVLVVYVVFWSCRCWVASHRFWQRVLPVMSLVGVLQVLLQGMGLGEEQGVVSASLVMPVCEGTC